MTFYFDSSAFAKLVLEEPDSEVAAQIFDAAQVISNIIAYVEVRAAIAAAQRIGWIDRQGLRGAKRDWDQAWQEVAPVEVTEPLVRVAGEFAERYALRGYDAVHLASAMVPRDDVTFVSWDRRLRTGAATFGLSVAPAQI